jgi:chloramphenicol-sensitive protein RarD
MPPPVSRPASPGSAATPNAAHERRRGLIALLSAFCTWGLLPLYLRALRAVPALEVMSHRLVWCCVCVLSVLAARGELGQVRAALRDPKARARLTLSALCISTNWLVYVWAVANGHVIESSLGYFINPLVNVLLGVLLLGERLERVQWIAVAIAAAGVSYLTWQAGAPPWIALVLACSFGTYGLLRKTVSVESLVGLGSETLLLAPLGLLYLIASEHAGRGVALHAAPYVLPLLLGGGPLTAIPLALFAYGARRVAYSTVGIVQYVGPTLQLLLGVFLFGEPFGTERAVGFSLIWTALALYAGHGLWRMRARANELAEAQLR